MSALTSFLLNYLLTLKRTKTFFKLYTVLNVVTDTREGLELTKGLNHKSEDISPFS
jgi:hypothetical protein